MKAGRRALATALVATSWSGIAAQAPTQTVCFRGHPLPKCGGFPVLELTLDKRVVSSSRSPNSVGIPFSFDAMGLEVGAMINRDSLHAIGATFGGATANPGGRGWIAMRRRDWATTDAVPAGSYRDLSIGFVATREFIDANPILSVMQRNAYGAFAQVTGGVGDLAGASASGELVFNGSKPVASIRFGLRAGSWITLVGVGVLGILVAATLSSEN